MHAANPQAAPARPLVARNLCEHALVNLAPTAGAPTASVVAGGMGASLPARHAVDFLPLLIVLPTICKYNTVYWVLCAGTTLRNTS